ncbi:MAG: DUF6600 domain-containing protein [Bacteroidales bacterium]
MKTRINFSIVFFIFCIGSGFIQQKAEAQQLSVNFQVFYDELSPYGSWIENPEYGYVWIPDVEAGFSPYATNGYWVYTDYGWTWVSDYSWGWAPFHYGRWYTDPYYGPMWIPDNVWGPGWVSWRSSSDYYGWAPMGPGISINMTYGNTYNEHFNNYTFVKGSYFGRRDVHNYYVNTTNNYTIINNTTVINNPRTISSRNTSYNAGPVRTEVERRGGRKITQIAVRENNKPGEKISKNQLQIYRPDLQKKKNDGQRIAPSKVVNIKEVKTSEQRIKEAPAKSTNNKLQQKPVQQRIDKPSQQKPIQQQRIDQPSKQKPTQLQRNDKPIQQQPKQQPQRIDKPAQQNPKQHQRIDQPIKQQPMQRPVQQNQVQPQRQEQPAQQRQNQPAVQPQRNNPPVRQPNKPEYKPKEEKRGR